ncbi:chemotaxis protein [Grimontia sp. AD028]|uniref:porin n=1 Tax=Grimontia sp. AD028 TaxID=1581149 RepID=UPI00061AFD4B|nr:porin [Grimontia sp. AD028]KKD62116.1 chemotaxis protein [Grimontia sp. AD028]
MEKMFKRSIVAAAVTAAAFGSTSVLAEAAFDIYGQVAVSVAQNAVTDTTDENAGKIEFDNDSRIGVRGTKDFERGPKIFWQMEGGNVGDDGSGSGLGVRDTYLGLDLEEAGKVRFGRLLTPFFEVVDGYTGQSSGAGFSISNPGSINYDRQPNMARYDSANLSGFSFSLAAGRGEESVKGSNVYGGSLQYTAGFFTGKAGLEQVDDREISATKGRGDATAYVLGANFDFDGFGFHTAYVTGEVDPEDNAQTKASQDAYKFGAYAVFADYWTANFNYAQANDFENGGVKQADTGTRAITAQLMYSLDPSAVVYGRLVHLDKDGANQDSDLGWRFGLEYYF